MCQSFHLVDKDFSGPLFIYLFISTKAFIYHTLSAFEDSKEDFDFDFDF